MKWFIAALVLCSLGLLGFCMIEVRHALDDLEKWRR